MNMSYLFFYKRTKIPGDPERKSEENYRKEGITFHTNLISALQKLAQDLKVAPLIVKE